MECKLLRKKRLGTVGSGTGFIGNEMNRKCRNHMVKEHPDLSKRRRNGMRTQPIRVSLHSFRICRCGTTTKVFRFSNHCSGRITRWENSSNICLPSSDHLSLRRNPHIGHSRIRAPDYDSYDQWRNQNFFGPQWFMIWFDLVVPYYYSISLFGVWTFYFS